MAGRSVIEKKDLLKVAVKMVEKEGIESINARDLAKNAESQQSQFIVFITV